MIHMDNGDFELELGDWAVIVTWPSLQVDYVEAWEIPILTAEVTRWFLERSVDEAVVRVNQNDEDPVFTLTITDPNLALEFKLHWCAARPRYVVRGRAGSIWRCCREERLYLERR